jgi:hypothetical protein
MASQDFLIQGPDLGLNDLLPSNMLDPREAAEGSDNILYEYGILRTPYGFTKLDLSSPLGGGNKILKLFNYKEYDGYTNLLAVSPDKIYSHNQDAQTWVDKMPTGESLNGSIYNPVSFVEYPHQDGVRLNNESSGTNYSYQHIIVCDGNGDIYRWAGRYETSFYKLTGGNGYHSGTSVNHRAKFIMANRSRLILISPMIQNVSGSWIENNTRIQWPMAGMLEATTAAGSTSAWSTTNTGAGYVELMETGGTNVCGYNLGGTAYVYQTQGIWALNYVGGTTVFSPLPMIPDVGIMGPNAICVKNNVHYLVGKDSNVYAYYGGTTIERIGDKVAKYLREDIEYSQAGRTMMVSDTDNKRIWIFIVPTGNAHMTKAYGMDLRTGAWMIRNFSDVFGSTHGVTAAALTGASKYEIGETYRDLLNKLSTYTSKGTGYSNIRYGDYLLDNSVRDFTVAGTEISSGTWTNGGLDYSKAGGNFSTYLNQGDILKVDDGSNGTNVEPGTHYYTLYDVSTNGIRIRPRTSRQMYLAFTGGNREFTIGAIATHDNTATAYGKVELCIKEAGDWTTGTACGRMILTGASGDWDTSTIWVKDTDEVDHSSASVNAADDITMTVLGVGSSAAAAPADWSMGKVGGVHIMAYRPDGETYKETQRTILKKETMVIGGSNGYIYEFSDSLTTDDGTASQSVHYTPYIDVQQPDLRKTWRKFVLSGKGSGVNVEYRLDEGTTWYNVGNLDLTAGRYIDKPFYIYKSSKNIQFRFSNYKSGTPLEISWNPFSTGWNVSYDIDDDFDISWNDYTFAGDQTTSTFSFHSDALAVMSICRAIKWTVGKRYKINASGTLQNTVYMTPDIAGNDYTEVGSPTDPVMFDITVWAKPVNKFIGFDFSSTGDHAGNFFKYGSVVISEDPTIGWYQIKDVKAVGVAIEGAV